MPTLTGRCTQTGAWNVGSDDTHKHSRAPFVVRHRRRDSKVGQGGPLVALLLCRSILCGPFCARLHQGVWHDGRSDSEGCDGNSLSQNKRNTTAESVRCCMLHLALSAHCLCDASRRCHQARAVYHGSAAGAVFRTASSSPFRRYSHAPSSSVNIMLFRNWNTGLLLVPRARCRKSLPLLSRRPVVCAAAHTGTPGWGCPPVSGCLNLRPPSLPTRVCSTGRSNQNTRLAAGVGDRDKHKQINPGGDKDVFCWKGETEGACMSLPHPYIRFMT